MSRLHTIFAEVTRELALFKTFRIGIQYGCQNNNIRGCSSKNDIKASFTRMKCGKAKWTGMDGESKRQAARGCSEKDGSLELR